MTEFSAELAASIRAVGRALTDGTGSRVAFRTGTIHTVTAGASADGVAAAVVTVDGNDIAAPYAASYTPTVGHLVMVLLIDNSPFILGRIVGLPVV